MNDVDLLEKRRDFEARRERLDSEAEEIEAAHTDLATRAGEHGVKVSVLEKEISEFYQEAVSYPKSVHVRGPR